MSRLPDQLAIVGLLLTVSLVLSAVVGEHAYGQYNFGAEGGGAATVTVNCRAVSANRLYGCEQFMALGPFW